MKTARSIRLARLVAYAAVIGSWLVLSGLIIRSGGSNLETDLLTLFGRFSHADAFHGFNGIAALVWFLHSLWCFLAVVFLMGRRHDVLAALLIGPALTVVFNAVAEDWSDPHWFQIVAVCAIGELVAILVAPTFWVVSQIRRKATK